MVHESDRERIHQAHLKHLEENEPFLVSFRMQHANGEYLRIESTGVATRDAEGKPELFVGSIVDVTESKKNYWDLQQRTEQLTMASTMSGFGYWRLDLLDDKMTWSDQVYVLHGLDPQKFEPDINSAIERFHPADQSRVRNHYVEAMENAAPFEFEARLVREDGEVRIIRTMGRFDSSDKDREAVVGVMVDITDKEREEQLKLTLEELSRSNEELNRFSYVCSHDMKEPVRMIENMSQLMLEPDVHEDETQSAELLTRIVNNAHRLRAIIDSLLAYSRIEAKVETAEVDLNEVIADVQSSLSVLIDETLPDIQVDVLPKVFGARVHYTQLFQNLVGNALKFTSHTRKKPKIKIKARKIKKEWVFTVEDNGPGIPREHRAHVFSLFSRLHLRDEIEGTGLGLSICQSIVSQYGGTIACDDSEMGGALFEIRLPVEETRRASAKA